MFIGFLYANICWLILFCRIIFAISISPYSINIFSTEEKLKNQIRVKRRKKYLALLGKFNKNLAEFNTKEYFFTAFFIFFLKDMEDSEAGLFLFSEETRVSENDLG